MIHRRCKTSPSTRRFASLAPLALAWNLGPAAFAQDEPPFEITDELLARIAGEAAPVVRAALDVKLDGVRVRLGTQAEIEAALTEENTPIFLRQLGDPEEAAEQARAFAGGIAPAFLAKYVFARDEVLVQAETFTRMAELLGLPELAGEQAVRGVVLHELVHAADDERHDLAQVFARCETADAVRAGNAVIEGHAQLVARELAPRLGCAEGFATYTRALTAPPRATEEAGEGAKIVQRTLSIFFGFSYTEGEAFFVALREEGGDEAVLRAFREPPADTTAISNPVWFLHPERRPPVAFELEPVLDAFAAGFDEDWGRQRLGVNAAEMRVSMAPLPPEEIDALAATIRQNRVQMLVREMGNTQIVLGIFEFATPADAAHYLKLYGRMHVGRDELMKEGSIRILGAEYEELKPPDPAGLLVEKRLTVNLVQVDVAALCIARGPLAVEALAMNADGWDTARLLEAALQVLDDVAKHPRVQMEDGAALTRATIVPVMRLERARKDGLPSRA